MSDQFNKYGSNRSGSTNRRVSRPQPQARKQFNMFQRRELPDMQRVRPENRLCARFACFQIPIYDRDFKMTSVLGQVLDRTHNAMQKQLRKEDFLEDFTLELNPRTGKVLERRGRNSDSLSWISMNQSKTVSSVAWATNYNSETVS